MASMFSRITLTLSVLIISLTATNLFAKERNRHKTHSSDGYSKIVHPIQLSPTHENRQLLCLADNIYFESRSEPVLGQIEIGYVTIERTKQDGYPSTVCEVVKQEGQFSWYNKRRYYVIKDKTAWVRAFVIAKGVQIGFLPNKYKGATHFHATWVRPGWKMRYAGITGRHKFYYPSIKG
jgi:spore germination cell wall hydrolase CwlJ-like protein